MDVILRKIRVMWSLEEEGYIVKNGMTWLLAMWVFVDDLVLIAKNEKDLRMMNECFYGIGLKRELRVNVAKSGVRVFGVEDGTIGNVEIQEV